MASVRLDLPLKWHVNVRVVEFPAGRPPLKFNIAALSIPYLNHDLDSVSVVTFDLDSASVRHWI